MTDDEIKELVKKGRAEVQLCMAQFFNCVYVGDKENDLLNRHSSVIDELCNALEEKIGAPCTSRIKPVVDMFNNAFKAIALSQEKRGVQDDETSSSGCDTMKA